MRTLRRKILFVFVPSAVILVGAVVLSFGVTNIYFRQLDRILAPSVQLNRLLSLIGTVTSSLDGYLSNRHSDSLNTFLTASSDLAVLAEQIPATLSRDSGQLLLFNIGTLVRTYLEVADGAMNDKRSRNIPGYLEKYREGQRLVTAIESFCARYNRLLLETSTQQYAALGKWIDLVQLGALLVLLAITLLGALFVGWFTWRVTNPLVILAKSVNNLPAENLLITGLPVTDDEIGVLAQAYEHLLLRIRSHVHEVEDRAKLAESLREAELKALQAQINPHFIFNTLNAGLQLAMFERADRTASLITQLSRLLRYNLRDLNKLVTLGEEIETCRTYLEILRTRFGEALRYSESLDPAASGLVMPALILQPLVENAWTHGLSARPNGGTIRLVSQVCDGHVVVTVEDDGEGGASDQPTSGSGLGIGLANVRSRLRLFFGREDLLTLVNEAGRGTRVIVELPITGGSHGSYSRRG